jgi:hypothetical protein
MKTTREFPEEFVDALTGLISKENESKVLETEPHDIAAIPAASLWELCRNFDAEAGAQPGGNYVGLQIFRHFKRLMKTRRVVTNGRRVF